MSVSPSLICFLERDMFPSKSDAEINNAIRNASGNLDLATESKLSQEGYAIVSAFTRHFVLRHCCHLQKSQWPSEEKAWCCIWGWGRSGCRRAKPGILLAYFAADEEGKWAEHQPLWRGQWSYLANTLCFLSRQWSLLCVWESSSPLHSPWRLWLSWPLACYVWVYCWWWNWFSVFLG